MAHTYDRRIAATTKTASWNGQVYYWITDRMVIVWTEGEFFGRVHHITGDLVHIEKKLEAIKSKLLDSPFRSLEIPYDTSDIYVDGLPGGRNAMKIEFYIKIVGKAWSESEQESMEPFVRRAGPTSSKRPPGF